MEAASAVPAHIPSSTHPVSQSNLAGQHSEFHIPNQRHAGSQIESDLTDLLRSLSFSNKEVIGPDSAPDKAPTTSGFEGRGVIHPPIPFPIDILILPHPTIPIPEPDRTTWASLPGPRHRQASPVQKESLLPHPSQGEDPSLGPAFWQRGAPAGPALQHRLL